MPGLYKAEGVVMRKRPLGEADDVVTLLSPTCGRLEAVARGLRKPKASLAGRLEPFTQVRLLLARGRSLDIISQAEVVRSRRLEDGDLYQIACGTYLLELFYRLVEPQPQGGDERIFAALVRSLDELEDSLGLSYDLICRRAELRLLTVLGLAPQLDACVICQERARLGFFTARGGGVMCVDCRQTEPCQSVTSTTLELLRALRLPSLSALAEASRGFSPSACLGAEQLLTSCLEWHGPGHMRSRRFLQQVRRV